MNLVEVRDLHVRYGAFEAVKGVSFSVGAGEIFGIVGESGSGKSTIAKVLMGLERASSGEVILSGPAPGRRLSMQMIFQDAVGSLNPRMTVRQTLDEVLRTGGSRRTAAELVDLVGLSEAVLSQYPREMIGGQCQRVSFARALAREPDVKNVCDRVAVMERGRFVDQGETADVFERPESPYTRRLLAAVPRIMV